MHLLISRIGVCPIGPSRSMGNGIKPRTLCVLSEIIMKPEETRTGMDFGLQAPVLEAIDMDEPVRVHLAKHYLLLKKTYRLESKS